MLPNSISTAATGKQQNLQRIDIVANRVSDPDTAESFGEIVDMKRAEQGVLVNTAVLRVANEMSGHLIDIVA